MNIIKTLFASVIAAAIAFSVVGCAPRTLKDTTYYGVKISPTVNGASTVADLDVAPKKVIGRASGVVASPHKSGSRIRNAELELAAFQSALQAGGEGGVNADVLVGARFHYEQVGYQQTVTVIGYPARYKNFQPEKKTGRGEMFTIENVGGMSVIGYDPSAVKVERVNGDLVIKGVKSAGTPPPTAQPASEAPGYAPASEYEVNPAAAEIPAAVPQYVPAAPAAGE